MLSPVYSRAASACPTPQVPVLRSFLSNGAATNASTFSSGETATVVSKLNRNANYLDISSTYGACGFGVLWGLDLLSTSTSGLTLGVDAGQAVSYGIVELTNVTGLTVPASATSYIWLKSNSSLTYASTLTPPTSSAVYLGCVTTGTTGFQVFDYSGRVLIKGGNLWRRVSLIPSDSPPSNIVLFTTTVGSCFVWDGFGHRRLSN